MDILNGAIESLISSSNKEEWTPVALSVADATVTISKHQVRPGQTAPLSFSALLIFPQSPDCVLFVLSVPVTLISTRLCASRMKRRCW